MVFFIKNARLYQLIVFCIASFGVLSAQQMAPPVIENPSINKENETDLNLEYVSGGDFVLGKLYDDSELIEIILSHPKLKVLNLSGQYDANPHVMAVIHDHLPQLRELKLTGSIRYINGDGDVFSSQQINWQEVSDEMIQALVQNHSNIKSVDFSLSSINDLGLELLSKGAKNLSKIYLKGAEGITDKGILTLVDKLHKIKMIDLSQVVLQQPYGMSKTVAPKVSDKLIQKLINQGITVIH